MHIEQNFFENIINTITDVPGKTKNNIKSRTDVADICDREELHLQPGLSGKTVKPKKQSSFLLCIKQECCVNE